MPQFRDKKLTPRSRRTVAQVQCSVDVRDAIDGAPVSEVVERLTRASEGLEDARLDLELDYEYGTSVLRARVEGWRDATPAEVANRHADRFEAEAKQRQREEAQVAALREKRPDLFK